MIDQRDFVSLHTKETPDRITRTMGHVFDRYLRDKSRTPPPLSWGEDLYYFQDGTISKIVPVIVVAIASSFLVEAMASFYNVSSIGAILGIVAAFTALFASILGLLTNAKRAEVLAATAA